MISEIIEKCPPGFEKVLELIIASELSSTKEYHNHYKISIDAKFYIDDLCGSGVKPFYYDGLHGIFILLKELGVIEDFKKHPYIKNDDYDHVDVLSDLYFDSETGNIMKDAPWDEAILYMKHGGPYYVSCNKEKVALFRDIVFKKKKKYICRMGMLKFLVNFSQKIDTESFLDFMELDEIYHFHDIEVLIYSIASSSRLNIAKMYYYLSRYIDNQWDDRSFGFEMTFEKEVVSDNSNYSYPDNFEDYYFNSSLDIELKKAIPEKALVISHSGESIRYDGHKKQLIIDDKYISLKIAKNQKELIEHLIKNKHRWVLSTEVLPLGIKDMEQTRKDLRGQFKKQNIDELTFKSIFPMFEHNKVQYCRFLDIQ